MRTSPYAYRKSLTPEDTKPPISTHYGLRRSKDWDILKVVAEEDWVLASLFQRIAICHCFEFHANGVGDGDDRSSLEGESRQHRTELMHFERIITFHQHISAPITNTDDERQDLEIGWRLPRAKDLQNSLLGILVFDGRALRTLVPGDHVLHNVTSSFIRVQVAGLAVRKVCAWGDTRGEQYSEEFPGASCWRFGFT